MALVLVDGRRIRQKIKEEYEKVVADLAAARAELDRFEQHDLPKFSRWVNSQFGALLTELRETARKLHECDERLAEMETEVIFLGVSPGRAYQRVMNRHRQAEAETSEDREERHANNSTRDDEPRRDYDSNPFDREDEPPPRRKTPKKIEIGARLKELYRALVRRLHPDMHKEVNRKKVEWWHQVQDAYEKGDEEQLEVILTLCEIDEAGNVEKASLSVLQRISKQFKKTLRQVRRRLEQSRKEPAWRFSVRKDVAVLAESMKAQLMRDLRTMREELSMLEQQLAAWAHQARQIRHRPVYRRRRTVDPFF
jgi:hypothetical protein